LGFLATSKMAPRCNIIVFDKSMNRHRKCLRGQNWKTICSCHARRFVIKIQAAWRSYKTRTRINIYKNLPTDAWRLILENIHHKNNVLQLCKSYKCVYERRMNRIKNTRGTGMWGNGMWAHREYGKNWIDLYIITSAHLNYYRNLLI